MVIDQRGADRVGINNNFSTNSLIHSGTAAAVTASLETVTGDGHWVTGDGHWGRSLGHWGRSLGTVTGSLGTVTGDGHWVTGDGHWGGTVTGDSVDDRLGPIGSHIGTQSATLTYPAVVFFWGGGEGAQGNWLTLLRGEEGMKGRSYCTKYFKIGNR